MSRKMPLVGILAAALVATLGVQEARADDDDKDDKPGRRCKYDLDVAPVDKGGVIGSSAEATITSKQLRIKIRKAVPKKLYTIWIDHRDRTNELLAPDYPFDEEGDDNPQVRSGPPGDIFNPDPLDPSFLFSGEGVKRGVAPAFATTAPVYAGMRIDLNSFVTDAHGNARFRVKLDYNLLGNGTSPVVAAEIVKQGPKNEVGGGWLRVYQGLISSGPSLQKVDERGLLEIYRSTAQGLTIVGHKDFVTHGHRPGDSSDRFGGFFGDFPPGCVAD